MNNKLKQVIAKMVLMVMILNPFAQASVAPLEIPQELENQKPAVQAGEAVSSVSESLPDGGHEAFLNDNPLAAVESGEGATAAIIPQSNKIPFLEDAETIFGRAPSSHKEENGATSNSSFSFVSYFDANGELMGTRNFTSVHFLNSDVAVNTVTWKNAADEILKEEKEEVEIPVQAVLTTQHRTQLPDAAPAENHLLVRFNEDEVEIGGLYKGYTVVGKWEYTQGDQSYRYYIIRKEGGDFTAEERETLVQADTLGISANPPGAVIGLSYPIDTTFRDSLINELKGQGLDASVWVDGIMINNFADLNVMVELLNALRDRTGVTYAEPDMLLKLQIGPPRVEILKPEMPTGTNPSTHPLDKNSPLLAEAKEHFGEGVVSGTQRNYGLDNPTVYFFYDANGTLVGRYARGGLLGLDKWESALIHFHVEAEKIFGLGVNSSKEINVYSNGGGNTGIEYYDFQGNLLGTRYYGFDENRGVHVTSWVSAAGELLKEEFGDKFIGIDPLPINPILLESGYTFNHNVAHATGFIREGSVTANYRMVSIWNEKDLGENVTGVIGKYTMDGETFVISGILENTVYELNERNILTVYPDGTGWIRDKNLKSNYKDIEVSVSQIIHDCPCNEYICAACIAPMPNLIALKEGEVVIGSYSVRTGSVTTHYMIHGMPTTKEITLNSGDVFTLNVADNTGFLTKGAVKENYTEVSSLILESCDSNGLCAVVDYMMVEGFKSIGAYTRQEGGKTNRYLLTGRHVSTEITLQTGKLTLHPDDKTGSLQSGAEKRIFSDIGFFETPACDNPDEACIQVQYLLAPGFQWIGSYTKRVGNRNFIVHVHGIPVSTEIDLGNGRTLNFNPEDNTGTVKDGNVKENYKNIFFSETGRMTCLGGGAMTENACTFEPALHMMVEGPFEFKHVKIGSFSKTVGNTTVYYDIYGELINKEITMGNGQVLTVNPKDNTGFVRDGNIQENFTEIGFMETMRCPAVGDGPCAVVDYMMAEGFKVIGSFQKHVGNQIITYVITGRPASTQINLQDGRVFTLNPDGKTGWLQIGENIKEHFEEVESAVTQVVDCPSNPEIGAPCQMSLGRVAIPEGRVVIGHYVIKKGTVMTTYLLHGVAVKREITMTDGKVFTVDLREPLMPVVRAHKQLSVLDKPLFMGSDLRVSSRALEDEEEEAKRKKKRKPLIRWY